MAKGASSLDKLVFAGLLIADQCYGKVQ